MPVCASLTMRFAHEAIVDGPSEPARSVSGAAVFKSTE